MRCQITELARMLRVATLSALAFFVPQALQAQVSATGDTPKATLNGSAGGTLSNSFISAAWKMVDGHLTGISIVGKGNASEPTLLLDGPFSIALKEAGVLRASDLTITGSAQIDNLQPQPEASRYSDRLPGVAVHYSMSDPSGRFQAQWTLVLRKDSHYVRQILKITTSDKSLPVEDVRLIDTNFRGVTVEGTVKGSPLVASNYYLGFESPLSQSSVVHDHAVSELPSGVGIGARQTAEYSAVIGVAPAHQMRRAFLEYVERERAHPYRTFLHYNSWFDIGFFTPYSQQDALDRIHEIGDALNKKRGVVLDSYLFDDGWDDHNDLWKIRADFKDGFTPLTKAAAEYGTAPGVWLSPWGGYGPPKQERVKTAKRDGYEIVDGGMALSGPKYYPLFHDAVTQMVTRYGVNQFKLDGTGNADQVVKGSEFSSDFDAAIHLIRDLRQLKPDIYINLTTGTYPSPFWLMYADSIWRGGDDTEFAGVGSSRERWITYRDADTYDEIVKAGHLFPLNSLMLHGIVYAQKAPHLETDPQGDFRNEVRSYFGSGTQLQELYVTPSLLSEKNWDDLAETAKWSRAHAKILVDTHWVGGDPRWLAIYGWAAWAHGKGILTLRNPSDRPQEFTLDIGSAFELPAGAATQYSMKSPWLEDRSKPAILLTAGKPYTFHLGPFEVLNLESLPK